MNVVELMVGWAAGVVIASAVILSCMYAVDRWLGRKGRSG